jgi:hypothetical protein
MGRMQKKKAKKMKQRSLMDAMKDNLIGPELAYKSRYEEYSREIRQEMQDMRRNQEREEVKKKALAEMYGMRKGYAPPTYMELGKLYKPRKEPDELPPGNCEDLWAEPFDPCGNSEESLLEQISGLDPMEEITGRINDALQGRFCDRCLRPLNMGNCVMQIESGQIIIEAHCNHCEAAEQGCPECLDTIEIVQQIGSYPKYVCANCGREWDELA